jgi:tetratricopeptide (TPR) repeat protein
MLLDQALEIIPDLDDLAPLRIALIRGSREDEQRRWSSSEAYSLLDTRVADPADLAAAVPDLVDEVASRVRRSFEAVAEAIRRIEAGDEKGAALALIEGGEAEEEAGRWEAAERFYMRAREIGRRPRDRGAESLATRRLARVERSRGALDEALRLYQESFDLAEAAGDREGSIVATQGLGNVFSDLERWVESGDWYRKGLKLHGEGPPSRLLWQLQSNLSVVARKRGDLAESRTWLQLARDTASSMGDSPDNVYLRNAAGLLAVADGDLNGAESMYRAGIAEASEPTERATLLVNLAECLLEQSRTAEAAALCREVEKVVMAQRLVGFLPYVYRTMGGIARARGDEEGFIFFEQAIELCEQPGVAAHELALTLHEYGSFEVAVGRTEAAAVRLEIAESLYRRLGMDSRAAEVAAERLAIARQLDRREAPSSDQPAD